MGVVVFGGETFVVGGTNKTGEVRVRGWVVVRVGGGGGVLRHWWY